MQVLAPCDPNEMKFATEWCANESNGPTYMRLGKAGEPILTEKADKFEFGKVRYLCKGSDIAIISYGITVKMAFELKEKFEKEGKSISIISCHTIKPLDKVGILQILVHHKKIIVVEEMIPTGGLSSSVSEIALKNNIFDKLKCFTLKDEFIKFYGNHEQLLSKHNLSAQYIYSNSSE
jgi:transketolase